jgi:hypothetical protein
MHKDLIKEPELRADAVTKINRARSHIKKEYVSHDEMLKEFGE